MNSKNSIGTNLDTHVGGFLVPKYEPIILWKKGNDSEETYDFDAKGNLWGNDVCLIVGTLGRYFQVVSRIGIGYIAYDNVKFI